MTSQFTALRFSGRFRVAQSSGPCFSTITAGSDTRPPGLRAGRGGPDPTAGGRRPLRLERPAASPSARSRPLTAREEPKMGLFNRARMDQAEDLAVRIGENLL